MTSLRTVPGEDAPSTYAIEALVDGEPGALGQVVILTAARAIPIGIGLRVMGERRSLVKKSVGASAAITVTMIGYIVGRKRGWW